MGSAVYRLANEDISDVVSSVEELMDKFRHGLPKDTQIEGRDHIRVGSLELPRYIHLKNPKRELKLPKTKVDGLYRLNK